VLARYFPAVQENRSVRPAIRLKFKPGNSRIQVHGGNGYAVILLQKSDKDIGTPSKSPNVGNCNIQNCDLAMPK